MGRVILTTYYTGDDHHVVGWDRAMDTYYWQEFAPEPEDEEGDEMIGYGGYTRGEFPSLRDLVKAVPEEWRWMVEVPEVLNELALQRDLDYPESNRIRDLTKTITVLTRLREPA